MLPPCYLVEIYRKHYRTSAFQFSTTCSPINYLEVRFKQVVCLSPPLFFYPKDGGSSKLRSVSPRLNSVKPRRQQPHLHNRHSENWKTFCPHVSFIASFQSTALFLVSVLLYILLPSCLFCTDRFRGCSNPPPSLLSCSSEPPTFSSQFEKNAQKHSESHGVPLSVFR